MIRKAAFIAWDPARDTTEYVHRSLADANKAGGPDDAMVAALAATASPAGLGPVLGPLWHLPSPLPDWHTGTYLLMG
jgi:hypothetical protein